MRKYKSNYLKQYVRKLKKKDRKTNNVDLRTLIKLSMYDVAGYKYVCIQRGTTGPIIVGKTKEEVKKSILAVNSNKDFNKWSNRVKKSCQKS